MYDFHNSTDTLKFWTEKQAINNFFVFHPILMKLGEIVVHMDNYNFTKLYQNQTKNKKVLLTTRFSVQNLKVSVESLKSYIVPCLLPQVVDCVLKWRKIKGCLITYLFNIYPSYLVPIYISGWKTVSKYKNIDHYEIFFVKLLL